MTAEIALLNKAAVTLAADSAVTINVGGSQKVYNSADKIFEATNYDAIGLMVYNNPEVQGIPIENIVKMYRDRYCKQTYETVFLFAEAFLKHLEAIPAPDVTTNETIYASLWPVFGRFRSLQQSAAERVINSLTEAPAEVTGGDEITQRLQDEYLTEFARELDRISGLPDQPWSAGLTPDDVLNAHSQAIDSVIDALFGEVRLSDPARAILTSAGALSLLKEYQPAILTGLVFAGYGTDEIFPSLIAFEVYGSVAGRLKHRETNKFDVDRRLVPVATVIPFAQQEMVDRFIYGMDAQFLQLCTTFFQGALGSLETGLLEAVEGLQGTAAESLRQAVGTATKAIMTEFEEELIPNHLNHSKGQISDIIRSMPKQELAALSESLVHLTSLKRKFSADAESVGGPIDVAMITRAEGFVWVRRKHFFEASLNPRYFHRRYAKPLPEADDAPQEEPR